MEASVVNDIDVLMQQGAYEVVRIADLHVDPAYQRDLSRDMVEKIREEWEESAAGAIVVSRRENGDLYIVNGQHRTAAASELGREEILAQVIPGLTSQDESRLRLLGNTRRNDTAQERFRAQVAAGDVESIAIQEILKQFGTRINPSADMHNGVNSVSGVEDLYRRDRNGLLLTSVMEIIRDSFGHMGGRAVGASTLKAIGWFLVKHRHEIDVRRFTERLAAEGIDSIDRKGRSFKAAMGGALWMNYYRAMIETYNARLSDAQKLEPMTGGWSNVAARDD